MCCCGCCCTAHFLWAMFIFQFLWKCPYKLEFTWNELNFVEWIFWHARKIHGHGLCNARTCCISLSQDRCASTFILTYRLKQQLHSNTITKRNYKVNFPTYCHTDRNQSANTFFYSIISCTPSHQTCTFHRCNCVQNNKLVVFVAIIFESYCWLFMRTLWQP